MALWSKKRVEASQLNGGREFVEGDGIRPSDINAIFNSVLHNQDVLENIKTFVNQLDSNENVTSSISYDENGMISLTFGIPQGEQGEKGEKGTSIRYHNTYSSNQIYYNNELYIDIVKYIDGNIYIPKSSVVQNVIPTQWNLFLSKGEQGSGGGNITIQNASGLNYSDSYAITNVVVNSDGSITCNLDLHKRVAFTTLEYNGQDITTQNQTYATLYTNYNSRENELTFVVYDEDSSIEVYCNEIARDNDLSVMYFKGYTKDNYEFYISLDYQGNLTLEKVWGNKLDVVVDLNFSDNVTYEEVITINNNFKENIEIVSINNLKVLNSSDLEQTILPNKTLELLKGGYGNLTYNDSVPYNVKVLYLYKNKLYYKNVYVIPYQTGETYNLRR